MNYRYMGSFVSPEGKSIVYLGKGDELLEIRAGQELSDGYVVEDLTEREIRLVYPRLDLRFTLPVSAGE